MSMDRREFIKSAAAATAVAATGGAATAGAAAQKTRKKAVVYFTRDLSAASFISMYKRVNAELTGKVAYKLHTGEPNGPNILPREWIRALLAELPGTVVETNVLYSSPRQTTAGHRRVLETNGWTAFTKVDILDEDGDVVLPVKGGKWLKGLHVGGHLLNYDSLAVLTHFKGHAMGGFGGSLKNIAIGCASGRVGKAELHHFGGQNWKGGPEFMEHMVEGGKAVVDHFGRRIAYVNVLRNMSVSCDCEGTSAQPVVTPDIGILASTDILAIDQASVDLVYALPEKDRAALVERIESRSGLRQLSYMKELGMGSAEYELVEV